MSIILSTSFNKDDSLLATLDSEYNVCVSSVSSGSISVGRCLKDDFSLANIVKEKVFLKFVDNSSLVTLILGRLYVLEVVEGMEGSLVLDHIGSVSPPSGSVCMDVCLGGILLGNTNGSVYIVNISGKVLGDYSVGDSVTAMCSFNDRLLVATRDGNLSLVDMCENRILSRHAGDKNCISISVDDRFNWFCAVYANSKLILGSVCGLSRVFESAISVTPITHTVFANVASSGLSVIGSGPTPQLSLFSLDLSTATLRMELDSLCAVTHMERSHSGDLIACVGVGGKTILDAHTLKQ